MAKGSRKSDKNTDLYQETQPLVSNPMTGNNNPEMIPYLMENMRQANLGLKAQQLTKSIRKILIPLKLISPESHQLSFKSRWKLNKILTPFYTLKVKNKD